MPAVVKGISGEREANIALSNTLGPQETWDPTACVQGGGARDGHKEWR